MNKRDQPRHWQVEYEDGFSYDGLDVCHNWHSGTNKCSGSRLNEVTIGDWLEIKRINSKPNSKEVYSVKFGDIEYIVRLNEKNEYVIKLRWADSFVNAKPTNIGQLMNSTANAKRKRS